MSVTVEEIKNPVKVELKDFELKFKKALQSRVPLLDRITHYIVKRKGKQIRPLFVFLSAKACGEITERTYNAASLIELLHTATLVHDDVVDDAFERRGFFSVNALWKNKIAVLVGDYLLSRGLLLSLDNEEYDLLQIVSKAVKLMSEGELLQIEKTRRLDISEDVYFEIIRNKTASLISAACKAGAASAGADKELIETMGDFGEKIGISFQIKDDLFDYGNLDIGKPVRIDIKEKKMTLPLIFALNNVSHSEKRAMINIVKNHNNDKKKVEELVRKVIAAGGIDYANRVMLDYRNQALDILKSLPPSEAVISLEKLIYYTTERQK